MARCDYCKKQGAAQKTAIRIWNNGKLKTTELDCCDEACKQNIHSFTSSYNKFAPKYMIVVMIWLLLYLGPFILQALTDNPFYVTVVAPIMLALMGAVLIIAPQGIMALKHYKRVGIRYFVLFIRLTGVLMIASAASMLWNG